MDYNIWDRNPWKSEVIGHCGGMKKLIDHAELKQSGKLIKIKIDFAASM